MPHALEEAPGPAYVGRFAPSPTGDLHLGTVATALLCAAAARSAGGLLILRVEDVDQPRVVSGAEERILEDLGWLGIRFDQGPAESGPSRPYRQSERGALYEAALELLAQRDLTFLCDCSRADIRSAASAPHAGDEGPRYPGTCRSFGMRRRSFRRPPAVRVRVGTEARGRYLDARRGEVTGAVCEQTGDFVLRRGDGIFAYQLAVVVDDLAMGVTDVVRGVDLETSAVRQAWLSAELGGALPRLTHVPLITGPGGARLSKRDRAAPLAVHRERRSPWSLARAIARAYGQRGDEHAEDPVDLVAASYDPSCWPEREVPVSRVLEELEA